MKKGFNILLMIFLGLSQISFSKIDIKVVEPMTFKRLNSEALGSKVIARGVLEKSTDDKENDYGKLLKFLFPKIGYLTNKKHWIKVEGFYIEKDDDELVLKKEKELVNFYGIIDRKNIGKWDFPPEVIEGNYIGYIPIDVAQYSKLPENIKKSK